MASYRLCSSKVGDFLQLCRYLLINLFTGLFFEKYVPSNHDEHIQTVPGLCQVGRLADQSHRYHLDAHLDGKECKYGVVGIFKNLTSYCRARRCVTTRLEHAKSDTVEQDYWHTDPLEPSDSNLGQGQTVWMRNKFTLSLFNVYNVAYRFTLLWSRDVTARLQSHSEV